MSEISVAVQSGLGQLRISMRRLLSISLGGLGFTSSTFTIQAQAEPQEIFHGIPFHTISTNLGPINISDIPGEKPAILFWPSVLSDASIYSGQVNAFRGQHRLVLIQPPGFGSPAPDRIFSMAECAEAVVEVMNSLGIDRATLVGTSWGGLVAVNVAARHAERVNALVLFSTPFTFPQGSPGLKERFMIWGARIMGNSTIFINGVADAFVTEKTRNDNGSSLKLWRDQLGTFEKQGMSMALRSVMIERQSEVYLLPLIKAKTVVVVGSEDTSVPVAIYRDGAEKIPGAEFVILNGASHIISVDTPREATKIIEQMLAEKPWDENIQKSIREPWLAIK